MEHIGRPIAKNHMRRRDFQVLNRSKTGSKLSCDAGVLWVTQPDDIRDYILLPGEQMTVTKRGKVLVEALREADFHLN